MIDIDFLREVIDGDREFEQELFTIFAKNAKINIAKMAEAIKKSDDNYWYMASHAFKGAASSIGAFELAKILEQAQKYSKTDEDQQKAILKKVEKEFKVVLDFIKMKGVFNEE